MVRENNDIWMLAMSPVVKEGKSNKLTPNQDKDYLNRFCIQTQNVTLTLSLKSCYFILKCFVVQNFAEHKFKLEYLRGSDEIDRGEGMPKPWPCDYAVQYDKIE